MNLGPLRRISRNAGLFWPYLVRYRRYYLAGLASLVVVDFINIARPLILGYATDLLITGGSPVQLAWLAALYLVLAVLLGVGRYFWRLCFMGPSMRVGRDLRREYFGHLTRMSQAFYHRRSTGNLMALATNDVEAARRTLGPGILISADALLYLILIPPIMLSISPVLTLCVFITFPLLPFFVRKMGQAIHRRYRSVQAQFARISGKVQESVAGIRVIKAFRREGSEAGAVRRLGQEYVDQNLRLAKIDAVFHPVMDLTMSLGVLALIAVGGTLVINGIITPGDFVAFQSFIGMLIWPMIALGWTMNIYQRGSASFLRLNELLEVEPEIRDPADPTELEEVQGALSLRGLSYSYDDGRPILQDVELEIPARTTLGIMGEVGSGKSTLVHLIPRLENPPPGRIFLDGVDITSLPLADLRRQIGFVPQDAFLFSQSIQENILFGAPPGSNGRLAQDMARRASVHEEITGFPGGYEAGLGERGLNLSGGQRQRITIARALARDPAILILDDALSSVDTQTEEEILQQLAQEMGRRTVILVAHRLSTLRLADRIVVLRDGRITEQGSHEELMALGGEYALTYRRQQMARELEESP